MSTINEKKAEKTIITIDQDRFGYSDTEIVLKSKHRIELMAEELKRSQEKSNSVGQS